MKPILRALAFLLLTLMGTQAMAAPCSVGSLASYVALGSSGCTIGSVTFADFALLSGPTGAVDFPVILTPYLAGTDVGFEFRSESTTDSALLDDVIGYRATGSATVAFLGADLSLAASTGLVTAIDNFCVNGSYSNAFICSSGIEETPLLVLGGFQDSDSTNFAGPYASLGIATDLGLDGSDGTASLGTVRSTLRLASAVMVPEPGSFALVGIGLLALLVRGRRRIGLPALA